LILRFAYHLLQDFDYNLTKTLQIPWLYSVFSSTVIIEYQWIMELIKGDSNGHYTMSPKSALEQIWNVYKNEKTLLLTRAVLEKLTL